MLLALVPLALLASHLPHASAQLGTALANISSNSTQMSYVSTWRSMITGGVYSAFSNASDASVTFSFEGVGVQYVAVKKYDRGLCQLVVDGVSSYTVDLYDNSGYTQYQTVIWTSPTLPYGKHNVTLQQVGPDARFGYYPYLFSETWIQVVPTNVASYTATQILTTATTGANPTSTAPSSSSSSSSTNLAPIVGGAVGGVVALALVAFLVFLWRKDKRSEARGGGRMIQRVRKAEGKMSIDDDAAAGGGMPVGYGRIDPGASGRGSSYGHGGDSWGATYESGESGSWGYGYATGAPHAPLPEAHEEIDSPGTTRRTSSAWGAEERDNRAYPYHAQGAGEDRRTYPVPEI